MGSKKYMKAIFTFGIEQHRIIGIKFKRRTEFNGFGIRSAININYTIGRIMLTKDGSGVDSPQMSLDTIIR
ncbi:unnamed protein product [marine sediment metagenome]|uniref:Uncharacterized protein n=1 Tax=marine sediment metagenome TaxID=412755 RepID=X1S3X4_9ZZZZ